MLGLMRLRFKSFRGMQEEFTSGDSASTAASQLEKEHSELKMYLDIATKVPINKMFSLLLVFVKSVVVVIVVAVIAVSGARSVVVAVSVALVVLVRY
jgi:hypothetical protein